MQLRVAQDIDTLQRAMTELAGRGGRVALVPTMGALHAGHMALIEAAKARANIVIASIFVNPAQFGPNEDFAKYPRMLESDLARLDAAGAALAYTPSVADIYPAGFSTSITVGPLSHVLEGATRPGHFDGVATIVAKLLLRVLPHVALFGEKDYQQLCVIRRLVFDMDMPIEIVGVPTLREGDGLAMSSRNSYLTPDERKVAPVLHQVLQDTLSQIRAGREVAQSLEKGKSTLAAAGFAPDYLALCDGATLAPLSALAPGARLLAAAKLGKTRLIDNIPIVIPA